MSERPGRSFEDSEVVELYLYRPPYPDAVFEKLLELAPRHNAALDIGCGPGKVARPLTRSFASVVAVDPSQNMIALGQTLPDGRAPNLLWMNSLAEDAPLDDRRFDLTTAAASIHWMNHDVLFPKLLSHAAPGHIFAAISGDDAFEPPWDAEWKRFLARWIPAVTGKPFDAQREDAAWILAVVSISQRPSGKAWRISSNASIRAIPGRIPNSVTALRHLTWSSQTSSVATPSGDN